jgi:transposase
MTKISRARYTLEFKQEAVRLVENGQSIAAMARTLGVVDQTLLNWVKAHRQGKVTGVDSKALWPPSRWRSAGCALSWRA